jgi:hypothetical protein
MKNYTKLQLKRFLNSTLKNKSLSDRDKYYRTMSELPSYLKKVLVGIILSDGYLERTSINGGVRLCLSFGKKHERYLNYLYLLFKPYVNTKPVTIKVFNKKTNTYNEVVRFKTISLPQLIVFHELFYNKGKKIIPSGIKELISAATLAHLIMGDGNLKLPDKIIRIYTNSFSKEEVELLSTTINENLNIETKISLDRKNQYMITLKKSELIKLRNLILEDFHPSMYYKLDIEETSNSKFD